MHDDAAPAAIHDFIVAELEILHLHRVVAREIVPERRLDGALVRTIVTCETCHRTLSSSIAVANAEPAAAETIAAESESARGSAATAPPAETLEEPAAKPAAQRKPTRAPAKATAAKSRIHKKTR